MVDADKPRCVRGVDAQSDRREAGEGTARAPGTPPADAEGAAPALEGPHRLPGRRQTVLPAPRQRQAPSLKSIASQEKEIRAPTSGGSRISQRGH